MNALAVVRYGAWATIALIGAIIAYVLLAPRPADQTAVAGRIGGPFVLPAHTGATVDSRSLAGRPFALFFGFTQCPDVCPTTMLEVGTVLKELDATPVAAAARDFRVYFVTVDPERDTPDLLRDYLSAFDSRIIGLLPTVETLPALARQFAAYYRKVPTSTGYTMDHTSAVYLFDRQGQFVGTLDANETRANQIAKMTRLLTR